MQGLIGIDIAEAREKSLVEQQRFHLAMTPVQVVVEHLRGKKCVQGFGPEPTGHFFRVRHQPDASKLARVVEDQPPPIRQVEVQPIVFFSRQAAILDE